MNSEACQMPKCCPAISNTKRHDVTTTENVSQGKS